MKNIIVLYSTLLLQFFLWAHTGLTTHPFLSNGLHLSCTFAIPIWRFALWTYLWRLIWNLRIPFVTAPIAFQFFWFKWLVAMRAYYHNSILCFTIPVRLFLIITSKVYKTIGICSTRNIYLGVHIVSHDNECKRSTWKGNQ